MFPQGENSITPSPSPSSRNYQIPKQSPKLARMPERNQRIQRSCNNKMATSAKYSPYKWK